MVYFIGHRKKHDLEIEALRERLLENSSEMLSLFRERVNLAKLIGSVKVAENLHFRDSKREQLVRKSLAVSLPIEERFLNLLFELTVISESAGSREPGFPSDQDQSITIEGEADSLQKISAMFLFQPGDSLFIPAGSNLPFARAAAERGAHIVEDNCPSFDHLLSIGRENREADVSLYQNRLVVQSRVFRRLHSPMVFLMECE